MAQIQDEELIDMRKKLKKWKKTGLKQTLSILQKIAQYDITNRQIKNTKISKTLVRISLEKPENEEETEIIRLSDSIAKNMKIKYGKLKEEEKKSPKKERNPEKIEEKFAKSPKTNELTDKLREGFCKNLLGILQAETANLKQKVEESDLKTLVHEIDEELFKKNKGVTTGKYREDARTICSNLRVPHNSELRVQVIERRISPETLAQCDPLTLQSKISQDMGKKILQESLQGSQLDWDKEKMLKTAQPGGVRCINPKCRSDKTITTTAQIRRADEGMTEFHKCLACGKDWRG